MKTGLLLSGILLSGLLAFGLGAGEMRPSDGKHFRLPPEAAPGGSVRGVLKSSVPVRIRLNGKILGVYTPEKGVVTVDFTPAVRYASGNTVECRPAAALVSVSFEESVPEHAVITRLRRERIKLNASSAQPAARAARLHGTGFNMAMGWSGIHSGVRKEKTADSGALVSADNLPRLAFLRNEIATAKAHDLIPIPLIWYHRETQEIMDRTAYEKCRSIGYGVQKTPCPLDSVYWDRLIAPTLKIIASLYRELDAPGGVMLDQEFYAGGYPGFTYGGAQDGCYCDSCMRSFFEAVGEEVDLSKAGGKRLEYILRADIPWRITRGFWKCVSPGSSGRSCGRSGLSSRTFSSD